MPGASTRPLRIGEGIDLYLGELARRGRSPRTIDAYRRKLNALANTVHDAYVHEIELADYERFVNRWAGSAPSTLAGSVPAVASLIAVIPFVVRTHG